jgi:phosphopantetheine adenylyltransferase
MTLVCNNKIMITSLSDEVARVSRRGQAKDFEVAYKQLDDFVDVSSALGRK